MSDKKASLSLTQRLRWVPPIEVQPRLFGGKKAQNLAHYAFALIGLEEILRMRRAFQDDQLLGLRSLLILGANPRQTGSISARIVARDDEQRGRMQFFRRLIRSCAEHNHAANLAGLRRNRRIAGGSAAHATANDGDAL